MPITCQVVTKPMRNLLRARNGHVIGPLRAYYVPHVTRYVVYPCNSLYYVHVIESVRRYSLQGFDEKTPDMREIRPMERTC